jgi:hypothetical protein
MTKKKFQARRYDEGGGKKIEKSPLIPLINKGEITNIKHPILEFPYK